jgi:NAD(P)-dependent dehydrogenase (short-subunit alcohol dehydrogenase family)
MGRVEGKVAIVTGAGSGIGRASAMLLAKEGAKTVVVDRNAEAGEETVRMIREAGGEAIFVKADVSEAEDIKKMVKTAVSTYGKLNILFNNAGFIHEVAPTADASEEVFDETIATNLKGAFMGMKYAIPEMLRIGGGSIINIASIAGTKGVTNAPAYAASKGGVLALSRATAIEYATQNIRVNCISPGTISTPAMAALMKDDPEIKRNYEEAVPQGRLGRPDEVAQVVLFLASDEASHVTGEKLAIDGGLEADSHLRTR